jgi:hypothetical protein
MIRPPSQSTTRDKVADIDWGLVQWAPNLLQLFHDSATGCFESACNMLLGDRYFRCKVAIPETFEYNNVDKMDELKEWARSADLSELFRWVRANVLK